MAFAGMPARRFAGIYLFIAGILKDNRTGADDVILADADMVAQRRIDTDKCPLADRYTAGNNDVRGNEAMVFYRYMMTDMVAAPEYNVITDGRIRLNGIVLQDKCMLSDP